MKQQGNGTVAENSANKCILFFAPYYDPSSSRMFSEDPVRNGINWYTYCMNDPIYYIDLWGLIEVNARDYAVKNGAKDSDVVWLGNYTSAGVTYAKANVTYNGKTILITGELKNNKLTIDNSVLNTAFGWGSPSAPSSQITPKPQIVPTPTMAPSSSSPKSTIDGLAMSSKNKDKPGFIPRKDPRKGAEERQPSGDRERNVAHPEGEEHSRVSKGNKSPQGNQGGQRFDSGYSVPIPVPVPTPIPTQPNTAIRNDNYYSNAPDYVDEIIGWGLAGTALYWIISEGSRIVFPPRNFIPIP